MCCINARTDIVRHPTAACIELYLRATSLLPTGRSLVVSIPVTTHSLFAAAFTGQDGHKTDAHKNAAYSHVSDTEPPT